MSQAEDLQPENGHGALSSDTIAAVERLAASYIALTDRPTDWSVADLFTVQGKLTLGALALDGRMAIAEFFNDRTDSYAAAGRVTRHIVGPLNLLPLGDGRIAGQSTATVFTGSGTLPLPAALPSTICDFDDIFVLEDRQWLFAARVASIIFTGAGAANFTK